MRLGEPPECKRHQHHAASRRVLVLLIIFMVMAPQMRKGPDVNLPNTTKPNSQGDERGRILISIDEAGDLDQRPASRSRAFRRDSPRCRGCRGRTPRSLSGAMQSSISARFGRS